MLHHESLSRSGFGQGLVATNLYSNAAHVFSYYTKVRGRNGYQGNDIDSFELAGGNPHLLSAGLLAYSAYALHRMHKKNYRGSLLMSVSEEGSRCLLWPLSRLCFDQAADDVDDFIRFLFIDILALDH